MTSLGLRVVFAVGWLLAGVAAQVLPRGCMPDDVLVVVEASDAVAFVGDLFVTLGAVPKDLPETVRTEIALGLTAIRLGLGATPSVLARQLAQGGFAVGLRFGKDGAVEMLLALRPGDAKAARAFLLKAGEALQVVERGEWLFAASSGAGCDALLAQVAAPNGRWAKWPGAEDLATNAVAAESPLRAYLDLKALRAHGGLDKKLANMVGAVRFLLAPLLPALWSAPRATIELHAGASLRLTMRAEQAPVAGDANASTPMAAGDVAVVLPWRELLVAGQKERTIIAPPDGALAVLSLDRSVRKLLEQPEHFLLPAEVTQVQAFLAVADQLDGPRSSFVADLVGGLVAPFTLYVLAPTPPFLSDAPLLLLPGIALLARTQNAQSERVLSRTAQVLLLIGNAERAQRHEVPFVLRKVNDLGDGVHGLTATLPEWRKQTLPPTEYGIEPSLLFGFDHMVLASNLAAAQAMLLQVKNGAQQALSGDVLLLHGMPIAAAVEQSQRPLLLARMLDEGESEATANRFYEIAKGLLRALDFLALRMHASASHTSFEIELRRRS